MSKLINAKFDSFIMTSKVKELGCLLYICTLSSQDGTTPLYIASQEGHSQVAELLLSKGAGINLPRKVQLHSVDI